MFRKDYTYAVARIRSKELGLFSGATMEQLVACKSYAEALHFLIEKGWGGTEEVRDAEALFKAEKEKNWQLIGEMVDDLAVFDVLRIADDFHNLKAAIKLIYTNSTLPPERVFLDSGRLDADAVLQNVTAKNFAALHGRRSLPGFVKS